MTKVFFTYVWGPPGNPAWPMKFAFTAARMLPPASAHPEKPLLAEDHF